MTIKIRKHLSIPFKIFAKIFLAMFLFFGVIGSLVHLGMDETLKRLEKYVEHIKKLEMKND